MAQFNQAELAWNWGLALTAGMSQTGGVCLAAAAAETRKAAPGALSLN
jgi:hypothetical protein